MVLTVIQKTKCIFMQNPGGGSQRIWDFGIWDKRPPEQDLRVGDIG